jgi:hypothetical protein
MVVHVREDAANQIGSTRRMLPTADGARSDSLDAHYHPILLANILVQRHGIVVSIARSYMYFRFNLIQKSSCRLLVFLFNDLYDAIFFLQICFWGISISMPPSLALLSSPIQRSMNIEFLFFFLSLSMRPAACSQDSNNTVESGMSGICEMYLSSRIFGICVC